MTILPSISELAKESYLQYEVVTGITLPRDSDGQFDFSNGAFRDNDVDAFRHAYVMGKLTMSGVPSSVVKLIGIDHENEVDMQESHDMDLWNNSIGIKLGGMAFSEEELGNLVKQAMDNGRLITSPRLINEQERAEVTSTIKEFLGDLLAAGNPSISSLIQSLLQSLTQAEATAQTFRYDPLTLDLNHNGRIDLIALSNSKAFFDLEGSGFKHKVGWVGGNDANNDGIVDDVNNNGSRLDDADGMLVLDANNNGSVDNINELFGYRDASGNIVPGTAELAVHDLNHDNKIDGQDNIFNQLKVWQDFDGDGITDAGELSTLANHNITAINLSNITNSNQNVSGNVILSTGTFNYNTGAADLTGTLANLDLAMDPTNSSSYTYQDSQGNTVSYNLNLETLSLPLSRGYGNVKAWHIAMSENADLLALMKDVVNLTGGVTLQNINQKIEQFIYQWTAAENVTGMRGSFDAKKLAAMEAIRGVQYTSNGGHDVQNWQVAFVQDAWNVLFNDVKNKILVQGTIKHLFDGAYYNFATDTMMWKGSVFNYKIGLGTEGNDTLVGSNGNDIITGGLGDDVLGSSSGNYGDETYIYNKGNGKDTIYEYTNSSSSSYGTDKIVLGADIARSDVYFTIGSNQYDLIINFRNSPSDQITIYYQFLSTANRVESIEFANGTDAAINISNPSALTFEYFGTDGDDTVNYPYGYSVIDSGAGNDTITTGNYNDIINAGAGNDIINAGAGNNTITGGAGNDYIRVGAGNDTTNTRSYNDIITGGTGDDIISSSSGSNGNYGDDTYIFNKGDGKDTIYEYEQTGGNNNSYGTDKIVFGADISRSDIYFTIGANQPDLIINFRNSPNDQITIKNQFRSQADNVEILKFSDGSTLDTSNQSVLTFEYLGTDGADTINARSGFNIIDTGLGNDTITSGSNNDIINAGAGDDTINSGSGNDIIDAGAGNDTIYVGNGDDIINAGSGNDIIDAGAGNDIITGGAGDDIIGGGTATRNLGDDTYIFNKGDGKDTIYEYNTTSGTNSSYGTDKIVLGADISRSDIYFTLSANQFDLIINFRNSPNDQITIKNQFRFLADRVETINFINGDAAIDITTNRSLLIFEYFGTDGNDTINGSYSNDIINAGAGDDIIGGGANDANLGNDTYIFNKGDGKDIIAENTRGYSGSLGIDNITFGSAINKSDVYFVEQSGSDLIIRFRNSPDDQITIKNQFRSINDNVETLKFSDGSVWDITNKTTLGSEYPGVDDIINAGSGDDIIGGGANDANFGNDTYIFNKGDGKDTIYEYNQTNGSNNSYGTDNITFGTDISKSDIYFTLSANQQDLIINFRNSSTDQITIKNQFRTLADRIETLKFSDESTLDITSQSTLTFEYFGTAGNDSLSISNYNNIINAGAGDDIIGGGTAPYNLGNNTYIFNKGDGKDTIYEYNQTSGSDGSLGADNITFGTDISKSDIYFTLSANRQDLIINFRNSSTDQITIKNQFRSIADKVETLKFIDGSTLDITNPYALTFEYFGTDGNDTITGSLYNDIITGGLGDDIMRNNTSGNYGDDTYIFNKGDGKDTIYEFITTSSGNYSYGTDKIVLGADISRSDIYFTLGTSQHDLIINFRNSPNDQITIKNQFRSLVDRIETLKFSDGSTLDIANKAILGFEYQGTAGNDTITAGSGNDTILGSFGNDTLNGGNGNDIINGQDDNDYLDGGAGDDKLNGGAGIDNLLGGAGKDSFIFDSIESSNNSNPDLIMDFLHSEDLIDFSAISSINSISDLNITNDGVNTLIDDQNSDFAVKLSGVKLLAADDFIFHG